MTDLDKLDHRLVVGNCSGFYGDRLSAMREMLEGGPLDVLTGDYLAELTMLILGKDTMKDASLGYARTFVRQAAEAREVAASGLGAALQDVPGDHRTGQRVVRRGLPAEVRHRRPDDQRGVGDPAGHDHVGAAPQRGGDAEAA